MNITDIVFLSFAVILAVTANRRGRVLPLLILLEFSISALIATWIIIDPLHFAVMALKDVLLMRLIVLLKSLFSRFYARIIIGSLFASQSINLAVFFEYYPGGTFYFYDTHYPIMSAICVVQLMVMASNGRIGNFISNTLAAWYRICFRRSVYQVNRK